MTETYHPSFKRKMISIYPGEYHVDSSPVVISTLLGSCVAVVLFDPATTIGGMNHFMLPEVVNEQRFYLSSAGKYGMYAMELLINGMIKKGAQKKNLKAKVFGGSSMFSNLTQTTRSISENNIKVALNYLAMENIPVVSSDFGGNLSRRLYFLTDSYKVYVKKARKIPQETIEQQEHKYLQKIQTLKKVKRSFFFRTI